MEAPHCVICLQDLVNDLTATPCGHVFHTACIQQCLYSSGKHCPLCRNKSSPAKLLYLNFNLGEKAEKRAELGNLTDEEAKSVLVLQDKIVELTRNVRRYEDKVKELTKLIDVSKEKCEKAQNDVKEERDISMGVRKEYQKAQNSVNSLTYDLDKYKGLYKNAHESLRKAEERKNELEMTAKLLEEISASKSTHDWANSVKENLTPNEQATQFYNALMVTENNLKTYENEIKDFKLALKREEEAKRALKREYCKMKKELDRFKLAYIRQEKEQDLTSRNKRNHEEMLQSDIVIETINPHAVNQENPPKRIKILSLIDKPIPTEEILTNFTIKPMRTPSSLINSDITHYLRR